MFKIFLQGFIIGLGKIMPGVSGSVMAICFGVYERIIGCLSSIKKFRSDFRFISILGLGLVLAIIFGSNLIKILLLNHYVSTMMFFIGMMVPGIFPIIKEVKNTDLNFTNISICVGIFLILLMLNTLGTTSREIVDTSYFHEFISLFLCGIVDAASTIIPGISGSALLMLFGYYEVIISALANALTLSSLLTIIPFLSGLVFGVILTSKLVTYLFCHHRVLTHMIIVVFAMFSVVALLLKMLAFTGDLNLLMVNTIFLIIGFASTIILEKLFTK